jgi:hypothetical protein
MRLQTQQRGEQIRARRGQDGGSIKDGGGCSEDADESARWERSNNQTTGREEEEEVFVRSPCLGTGLPLAP